MAALTGNTQIERIDLLRDDIPAPLSNLFSEFEAQHPQFGLDWLINLARHALDQGDRALIYCARSDAGDLAALPLRLSSSGHAGALANFYTSLYAPVFSGTDALPLLADILGYLRCNERAHSILLSPLDADSAVFQSMQSALERTGWKGAHPFTSFANWFYETGGGNWESYLQERPSKLRNTIARKTRAFLRDDRGELKIISGGGDDLNTAIAAYTSIYSDSWKRDEPYPDFIANLIRLAAGRGWLRLGVACYDGQAVASQIWLTARGTAYIFKLAYRPEFAQLSPGTVLTAHMLEHSIDRDGVSCIDYLSGDDSYKRDWMSVRRERVGLAAFNPATLRGQLGLLREKAKPLLKRLGLRD